MKVYVVKGVGDNCKNILFKTSESAKNYILPKLLEETRRNANLNNAANIIFRIEPIDYTFKSIVRKNVVKVETYEIGTDKKRYTISRKIQEVEVLE